MGKIVGLLLLFMLAFACEKSTVPPYWGYAVEGFPTSESIEMLKKETPFFPDFLSFYLQWPKGDEAFVVPSESFDAIWKAGSVPILTWEPMYYENNQKKSIDLTDVMAGMYDAYMSQVAESIKAYKKPLLLRFAHEMNLEEYRWGMKGNYNEEAPQRYQKLFRYVVDLFRKAHVDNVLWVFCPNADSMPNVPWNVAAAYYPGDDYVDILGMDGYNWSGTTSFESVLNSLYHQLKAINPKKPILVFETAADGTSQQKQAWIKAAQDTAETWGLTGIIWFQVNKERKWKMPYPAEALFRTPPPHSAQKWAQDLLRNLH